MYTNLQTIFFEIVRIFAIFELLCMFKQVCIKHTITPVFMKIYIEEVVVNISEAKLKRESEQS